MSSKISRSGRHRAEATFGVGRRAATAMIALGLGLFVGCQDGPLYALKTVNPYFPLKDWREDEAYGITDHQRRKQLSELAGTIAKQSTERQTYWAGHLNQLMEHDPSSEMRRIAVQAAGNMRVAEAKPIIEAGLDDDSLKVRMEACRALGRQDDEASSRRLAEVMGSDPDLDVKHAAMAALGNHANSVATDALRMALRNRNPATRHLAVRALKDSTGKDYGDDPQVWIAALDGDDIEEQPTSLASRLRALF